MSFTCIKHYFPASARSRSPRFSIGEKKFTLLRDTLVILARQRSFKFTLSLDPEIYIGSIEIDISRK